MRVTVPNLPPGVPHAVQVRAIRDGLVSEWSDRFLFTTDQNGAAPTAPTSVTWVVSDDAFVAGWAPVSTDVSGKAALVTSYEMEFTASGTSKIITIPQKTGGNLVYTLSFAENVALFGTPKPSVDFRVRAVNNKGVKSAWSGSINAANAKPSAPTGFTANALVDAIELSWTASPDTDLAGYNIYTGTPSTFTPSAGNKIFSGNVTRFIYRTTTYSLQYFKIRAVDKFGQESDLPDASASATPTSSFGADTTAPATPAGLAAAMVTSANAETTQANLTWTANAETDLAGYIIRYRKTGDTNWSFQNVGKVTAASILGLLPYINYDFQIQAVDFSANESSPSGTVTGTGATNANPLQPQAPGVASNTLQIQVTPTGNRQSDGTAMAADVEYYEVYASNSAASFTPGPTNQLGVIPVGPAMAATFQIPAGGGAANETWYVKVIAVDTGGLKGSASPSATASPTLVAATNIVDLAVTNAKINNLNADKIVAGSGIINNITVKSTLTMGDASNNGIIQSFDYAAGSLGYKLEKNTLEINQGVIRAPAIAVQIGNNIIAPKWADFEANNYPASAVWPATSNTSLNVTIDTVTPYINKQSLRVSNTSGAARTTWFADSLTDYHTRLQPSTRYIVSFYAWNAGGATVTGNAALKLNNGATVVGTPVTFANSASWIRYTFVITTGAGSIASGYPGLVLDNTGTLLIDAVQIEQAFNATITSASPFALPGMTTIDGGLIRTGSIISTDITTIEGVAQPTWSIPLNGAATFANLKVMGNTVLGKSADDPDSMISSSNYIADVQGWRMLGTGEVEFRQVKTNSLNGQAIVTDTLYADRIASSTGTEGALNAVIKLQGALVAEGALGEEVKLASDGFSVIGSHETSVSTKAQTTQTVTLVTTLAHGYQAGSEVIVSGSIGTPFPTTGGRYTIASVPTSTSLTITSTTFTSQTIGTTSVTGSVQGRDVTGTRDRPVYINFPTDGTKPNIISGVLTSSTLVVTEGATFRGISGIEAGATLTIASAILPPKAGPTPTADYGLVTFLGDTTGKFAKTGFARGHNGNDFILSYSTGADNNVYLDEYNAATGAKIATRVTILPVFGYTSAGKGIVYDAGRSKYYLLLTRTHNTTGIRTEWIYTLDTSYAVYAQRSINVQSTDTMDSTIGWDHVNNRMMYAIVAPSEVTVWEYEPDVNGIFQNTPPPIYQQVSLAGTSAALDISYVGRGVFDFGVERIVVKGRTTSGASGWGSVFWVADATTGAAVSNDQWYAAGGNTAGAIWTGGNTAAGNFYSYATAGARYEYSGGDSKWSGALSQVRWLAYSWYDPVGTTHETNLSPVSVINLAKRGKVKVTIAPIPAGVGADAPTQARIWMSPKTTEPTATDATWKLRETINTPLTSAKINPNTTPPADTPSGTNGFASITANPGIIQSTTGNSFWKGDDTAQFYQLTITSATDVTSTTGNKPPLRIGNIAGDHLRIDGNEILGMSSDTAPGTLILQNDAAAKLRLGKEGKAFGAMQMGLTALTTGVAGTDTIPHLLNAVPDVILVTSFNAGGNVRFPTVTAKNSTNFTVNVKDAAMANFSGNPSMFWIAIVF